jgi:hypothetical protein
MHGMTSGPARTELRVGYRATPAGEQQARVLQDLERACGRRRAEIVAELPMEHDQYRRYLRGDTPLRWDQIATFAAAYRVSAASVAKLLGLVEEPPDAPPKLVETRFSHDWDELQRQVADLDVPDEIREQILRGFRESIAVLHAASELVRRN